MDEGPNRLARCRQGHDAWAEVACGEAADEDVQWRDPNAERRHALLLALQYDLQPKDRALVRYLFEQEALRHRWEPFQGLYPALQLAGYLLATLCAVEDVWPFAEPKLANFDTFLSFDLEYLVSAGIEGTLAYVPTPSTHPLRQDILEWLVREDGQCVIGEDELAPWWRRMEARYPTHRADEDAKARLDQALQLGYLEDARHWLEAWDETQPRTPRHLRKAAWYWAQLRDWDRAAAIAAQFLACDGLDALDQASMQVQAVGYHRKAGRAAEAWKQLAMARETLKGIDEWWRIGFGRSALEEALLIAQALLPGDEGGREAYEWASEQLARRESLHSTCCRWPKRQRFRWATKKDVHSIAIGLCENVGASTGR